ncbi:hypothetical protein GCM10011487_60870 [Steroidobacter agaridevorans]|uniref:IPT/TIG domain-containing protein n=1 Tax=Steroidobacter agaridevorans TaxID=2695856 RepID=A0A829YL41_9GAMM|nr:IPT/TIG domain-containing protein [Steroidobacter agaridevorans]GFE84087.1 hypothetical protein GCM10011487_60870 [Steroidobacter agaridevorans]GFE86910.1 hypothetical protein GCM10011488_18640 [Steroidobacter agaridevorans]
MRALRLLGVFIAFGCISACSGGGGGGGGGSNGNFSIASTSVTFTAPLNGVTPAPQTITGSITGVQSNVYLYVLHTDTAIATASVSVTGSTSGELTIFPKRPQAIGLGTFTDTVTVRACLDSNCAREISGSPRTISVTYNVVGIAVEQASVALSAVEGTPSQPATVNVRNASGNGALTASVTYNTGSDWLTVTLANAASTTPTATLVGASNLAPGNYSAVVRFTAGSLSATMLVTYNVASNLGLAASNVSFSAATGQNLPPPAQDLNVTAALASTTYSIAVTYGANGSGWLNASGGNAPGVLTLQPNATNLGPGTFAASVVLTPATGSSITLPVTYTLTASSLILQPTTSAFTINAASTSANSFLQRTVTTDATGAALNWTATSSVPWLTVTGSGTSGGQAILALVPSELEDLRNGQLAAVVTFNFTGTGVPNASSTYAVTLNLDLPTVDFVAPYVAYTNEQKEVVIRGSGFRQANLPQVMFGNAPAASVNVRSNTEIRAVPPAGLADGERPAIIIDNNLGLDRSQAELVVRDHPNYPYFALARDGGGIPSQHVIYDAERDAVITSITRPVNIVTRYQYLSGSGTWSATTLPYPELVDIAMSPDGRELLVLSSGRLHRADPVTLVSTSSVAVPNFNSVTTSQLAVANDGKVIIRDSARVYSLLDDTFTTLPGMTGYNGINMSPDGSRATMGAATNSFDIPLSYYDSATGTLNTTNAFQYYSPGSMDRHATKSLSGPYVRNDDFSVFGELRLGGGSLLGDVLSPDGERVYVFRYGTGSNPTGTIRIFDARVSQPVLPELTPPITIPASDYPGGTQLRISLDSRTLFLLGEDHFVVQPVP